MEAKPSQWHPEYARWMLEATPEKPYPYTMWALARICEQDIRARRIEATSRLHANEYLLSLAAFPALGSPDFLWNNGSGNCPVNGPIANSAFLPDASISVHPRFSTLTRNIMERRGGILVDIPLPVFRDTKTPWPFHQNIEKNGTETEGMIHLDAMGFGMGLCCLQSTLQCPSLQKAMFLYDRLAIIAPIMIALTASTPAIASYLLDIDARWDIISNSVDDRTPEERQSQKSRYASISTFLSTPSSHLNDLPLPINLRMYDTLLRAGNMETALARHFGFLFVRDPLVLYPGDNDERLFESIQSTNWNTVRLKLPSASLDIPTWRVEFRPMEAQLTDFESAAFLILIQLVSRAIIMGENPLIELIPISLLDQNIACAQKRDAVRLESFYWKRPGGTIEQLTIDEIINGPDGLLRIARAELSRLEKAEADHNCSLQNGPSGSGILGHSSIKREIGDHEPTGYDRNAIERYLTFIGERAAGRIPTPARAIREFIMGHRSYAKDSVVPKEAIYDLMQKLVLHSVLNVPII
ncbi:hypothetical protein DI09_77p40 [Mitosporidium daphniae]|uniref:Glutamate--cysteine ligase n=1 Tax=Mitosporidium daphniae TaxID=1485682 RepID=A0A098VNF6_9MICR|nr:uncharacterized protein DI09_77p40 [Mitosporidium daphniae]KGG50314.1 hypothetical protein DI09_77p40 [Mitosporidium daphniae]|eukprot:XP_013236757.1 uncharacterized protein DI09_77p40 [Mitosporidium daphniae]